MSYKVSAKNRKLKRTILNVISILKFESLNIETPKKIALFWVIVTFVALFLNWTEAVDVKHVWDAFKSFLWVTGYILVLINIKMIFILLSQKAKELAKMFLGFHAKDGVMIVFLGMFWLLVSANSIFIIENFSYFTTGILVGKWVIFAIVWYIFTIVGWFLMLRTKTKTSIYIENDDENMSLEEHESHESEKNNMKLPF